MNDPFEQVLLAVRDLEATRADLKITPDVTATEVREHLASVYGDFQHARPGEGVIQDITRMYTDWNLHVTHPRYFGLFNPGVLPESVAADLLVAAFNPQLAAWSHAPVANELERFTLEFFARRLGLPEATVAHFTSGGGEANHTAVVAALADRLGADQVEDRPADYAASGLIGRSSRPMIYVSAESHHSFDKIVRAVGLGRASLRRVGTDHQHRMDCTALRAAMARDRLDGHKPIMVVATAGTTGGGAIDPLEELGELCLAQDLWLHVDAAWGGAACLSDQMRDLLRGVETAQSVTWDAHKFLSVPMGAGMFFCRRPEALHTAFGAETPYMPMPTEHTSDPYSTTMQWSRRNIGLKVFLPLATLGQAGYAQIIEHQTAMGSELRSRLQEHEFRIVNHSVLPLVCFTHERLLQLGVGLNDQQAANERFLSAVTEENFWLSNVQLGTAVPVLRACITSYQTQLEDVSALVQALNKALLNLD